MFWEHVYDIVMRYSNRGRRTFSIADTLTGEYMTSSMTQLLVRRQIDLYHLKIPKHGNRRSALRIYLYIKQSENVKNTILTA